MTSSGDRILQSEEFQVRIEAQAKIQELFPDGQPARVELRISRLAKTAGGDTVELLKPSAIIIADGRQKPNYTSKNGALDAATEEALTVVYPVHHPESPSDDKIFGTDKPRAIGESWPMNNIVAAANFGKSFGIPIMPEQINGKVRLVGLGKIDSVDCTQIEAI